MTLRLSMTNIGPLFCALAMIAGGASEPLGVSQFRQAGAPLDVSVRQELEHTVDLATAWLARRQNADGSWGADTGRLWRTSVAALALSSRPGSHSDAIARAAVWLDRVRLTDAQTSEERAWRALALLASITAGESRSDFARRLLRESQELTPTADATGSAGQLWDDARRLAGIPVPPRPNPAASNLLCRLSLDPSRLLTAPPYSRWQDIRLINRAGNGQLLRDGVALDWRYGVALSLINAQQRDPAGGGFWRHSDDDVLQTAFAVLSLMEL